MIDIIRGASDKRVSTTALIKFVENAAIKEGILYTGYPIIDVSDSKSSVDALLISKEHGIIVWDIIEESTISDRSEDRDELYNAILQRFIGYKELTAKRGQLKANLTVLTFAPSWKNTTQENDTISTLQEFNTFIEKSKQDSLEEVDYRKLLQAVQAITKLKQKTPRKIKHEDSRGSILNEIEKSISNLDRQQSKAVIETVDGIQRIRGLAGSGKTIVLALKVAYLHSKNPDWTIGVTFNTRSLKNQFSELINKFTTWDYGDTPYLFGYYANTTAVTFCVLYNSEKEPISINSQKRKHPDICSERLAEFDLNKLSHRFKLMNLIRNICKFFYVLIFKFHLKC